MEIKNKKLVSLLENIENQTLSLKDIEEYIAAMNVDNLEELFNLILEEKVGFFPLKVYITGYSQDVVKELETRMDVDLINSIFASMWVYEVAPNGSTQTLIDAMLCFVLLSSDLPERIRKGASLNNLTNVLNEFEEQMNYLVLELDNQRFNNNFFNTITQNEEKMTDEIFELPEYKEMLLSMSKLRSRVKIGAELINDFQENNFERIKCCSIIEEHYLFLNPTIRNMADKSAKDVVNVSEEVNENKKDFSLTVDKCNETKLIDNDLLDLDEEDDEIEEMEVIRKSRKTGFFDSVKAFFENNKKNTERITVKQMTRQSTRKKRKNNSLATTIILISVLAICAIGFAVMTQKEKVNNDLLTPKKIAESTLTDKKFDIIREGTNQINELKNKEAIETK